MKKLAVLFFTMALLFGISNVAEAAFIDFTGGTAYLVGGGTVVPDGTFTTDWNEVDYYEENGFSLDFIGEGGIIGTYYGGNNDVIHGHWGTGEHGSLTSILVTKLDGTSFDLNYFILTSNTDNGGGAASGNEQTYINTSDGYSMLLPPDDWGWDGPNPQLWLDSNFDAIDWFSFTVGNAVDCFGMDNFYIDEPGPDPNGIIPEPSSLLLLTFGLLGTGIFRKRKRT